MPKIKDNMVEGPDGMSYYDHIKKNAHKDPLCKDALTKHYAGKYRKNISISKYDQ